MSGDPVTLINAFTVPRAESERFLRRWKDNAAFMVRQPGFVHARMYRAVADDVELRFINVAEWASREHLDAATGNPEFRALTRRLLDDPDLHVVPRPVVYEVAVDLHPDTSPGPGT